ncbi:MAG: T9SS type A sorting domain-containing protein, partial [Bacteroidota bacterium]
GYTNSFGVGNNDVYLIRTDANGNTIWSKAYGGPGLDFGYTLTQTTDGGFIVAGNTDNGAGNGDIYLLKVGSNGDTIFTKTYGGTGIDRASSVQQTSDGGLIIGGYTNSFGAGGNDFYLLKTNSNGIVSWAKTYGGTGGDNGNCVQQTADGGYIFVGNTMSFGAGANDVYLIKTDVSGTPVWSKTFGGASAEYGNSVQQTTNGGYIVAGYSASFTGVYLIQTDGSGNTLWSKTFAGAAFDWGSSVQQTSDGGFVIGGYTLSFGAGKMDISLIKTDANGNSGCNEAIPATISGTAATQTGTAAFIVSAGAQVHNTATVSHGGGTVATLCVTTGENEIAPVNAIAISPNPFINEFSIRGTSDHGVVILCDFTGKVIVRQNTVEGETKINTENLSTGLFVLTYFTGSEQKSFKIVKL